MLLAISLSAVLCAVPGGIGQVPIPPRGIGSIPVPAHMRLPVFGTVYQDKLYGLFDKGDLGYCLNWVDLKKSGPGFRGDASPARWFGGYDRFEIRFGKAWLSSGYPAEIKSMSPEELALFCRKSDVSSWDAYLKKYGQDKGDGGRIKLPGLAKRPLEGRPLFHNVVGLTGLAIVPTSENALKTFFLPEEKGDMEIWDTEARFDKKTLKWETVADEKNLHKIDSAFNEAFYAFIHKDTYYFITESGKLFYAPPPKKGETKRTMKGLWEFPKNPIVAVIEDADHDRVWLFTKNKEADAKRDHYFEMTEANRPQAFDPAKLAPVNVEGRAKMVLEYLPLIERKPR
jgi:hypothetical protein